MGSIPTNYKESTRWLDVINYGGQAIAPFAPCYLASARIGDQDFYVSSYGDGTPLSESIGLARSKIFSPDSLASIVINGPVEIGVGRHGSVTRDFPCIAMIGQSTESNSKINDLLGRPLVPSIGANGYADQLGKLDNSFLIQDDEVLQNYGVYGLYHRVSQAVTLQAIRLIDDGSENRGRAWVSAAAPKEAGYDVAFNFAWGAELTGDSGTLGVEASYYGFTSPWFNEDDAVIMPTLDYSETILNKPGIYDVVAHLMLSVAAPADSDTVKKCDLAVTLDWEAGWGSTDAPYTGGSVDLQLVAGVRWGGRTNGPSYDGPLQVVSLTPEIAKVVGGYSSSTFQFAARLVTLPFHARISLHGKPAILKFKWSRTGDSDLAVTVAGGYGFIRQVVNREINQAWGAFNAEFLATFGQ